MKKIFALLLISAISYSINSTATVSVSDTKTQVGAKWYPCYTQPVLVPAWDPVLGRTVLLPSTDTTCPTPVYGRPAWGRPFYGPYWGRPWGAVRYPRWARPSSGSGHDPYKIPEWQTRPQR